MPSLPRGAGVKFQRGKYISRENDKASWREATPLEVSLWSDRRLLLQTIGDVEWKLNKQQWSKEAMNNATEVLRLLGALSVWASRAAQTGSVGSRADLAILAERAGDAAARVRAHLGIGGEPL